MPASAVDPLYVEKSYYLGPDKGGERAYKLIRDAMLETGLVGIASYSARGKQYIVCAAPVPGGPDHPPAALRRRRSSRGREVPLPELPELKPAEIGLAKQIIQQIAHETFAPEKYKDEVQERMMELINKKVEGQEITVAPEAPAGKVIDLMEALKASLGMAKDAEPSASRRSPRRGRRRGERAKKKAARRRSTRPSVILVGARAAGRHGLRRAPARADGRQAARGHADREPVRAAHRVAVAEELHRREGRDASSGSASGS